MIQEELQKLEKLAYQVSKKLEAVSAENERLKAQIEQMTQENNQKQQEIEHFKNKIKISNIVDNRPVNPEDSTEMSDLINNYIQEIDHLITYLSN
jgi:regulator of replication initiation timing